MSCHLYLIAPSDLGSPDRPADTFARSLADILSTGAIDCLLLPRSEAGDAVTRSNIGLLRPLAQNLGVAVVVEDDAGLALETGCDGVHLTNPKAYAGARKLLGTDAIVGVDCGLSRHLAMEAADRGADYVAFRRPAPRESAGESAAEIAADSADPEADDAFPDEAAPTFEAVLEWWQAMIEVPCVALDALDEKDCAALAEAGADFVALGAGFWSAGGDPVETLKRIARKLA
jgi:thiamine-phosphate pyrophosphorylase